MHIPAWVYIAYFVVLWTVAMWKGQAFLALPYRTRLLVAFAVAVPWALLIILPHVT